MLTAATLIPIASALLAAITSIFARILLKDVSARQMLAVNFFIMGATLLVLSPLFYRFAVSWQSISLVFLIAVIDTLANYLYFKTLENTEASVAIPLLSLAPVATFIFSALFLAEYPSVTTILGALVIMILVVAISTDWQKLTHFKVATLYPGLASSALFGLSAIPTKYLLTTLAATNAPTLYMLRAGLIALFAVLIFKNSFSLLDINKYRLIFVRGIFVIGQYILLYYALTLGSAGVALTLGNITPVFVLILGAMFLGERFTWRKALAACTVLAISFII